MPAHAIRLRASVALRSVMPSMPSSAIARRHASSTTPTPTPTTTPTPTSTSTTTTTTTTASPDLSNPLLEQYLVQQAADRAANAPDSASNTSKNSKPTTSLRDGGSYTVPSPLFRPDRLLPGWRPDLPPADKAALHAHAEQRRQAVQREEEKRLLRVNLDPAPAARRSLERSLVIKGLAKHGRTTKAAKILRTERSSLYKSPFLPTSVKKVTKILNQLQGKSVSEALVQLRFSPKKVARDIYKGLLIAQDEAIAGRGMGLGDKNALKKWIEQRNEVASTLASLDDPTPKSARATTFIELKDGKKKLVSDPTDIYIDQAWCGRGESWKTPEFRARGRVNMLTHRTTSFTFLLKEEKTRIRISDEIKKKRDNRKLWVALPDRPVTAQRQYCLW